MVTLAVLVWVPADRSKLIPIGTVVYGLEVLAKLPSKKAPSGPMRSMWQVRCLKCDTEWAVNGSALRAPSRTTGCFHCKKSKPGTAFRKLFLRYKISARTRKFEWSLTDEQFRTLVTSPCHYTGKLPSQEIKSCAGEVFVYNGIDRRESDKGYTLDNCVSCCAEVNIMKNDLPYSEFLALVTKIRATLSL